MKFWVFILIVLTLLPACTKDNRDLVAPVIEALSTNGTKFKPNDVLNIDVSVSDNAALTQVRVRISQAFAKSFGEWEDLQVRDISGTSYQGTFSFVIPDSAQAGYYKIATQGADIDGNGTVDSLRYITILQPGHAPELVNFQTNLPMLDNLLFLTSTDTISFAGKVVDDINIEKVSILLRDENATTLESLSYNVSDSLAVWDFAKNADSMAVDFQDKTPTELLIKMLDSDGNQSRSSFEVDYSP